jgi:arabinogalactan endo-1,4-beta-galactosidase
MASKLLITLTIPALLGAFLVVSPASYEEVRRELASHFGVGDDPNQTDCSDLPMSELRGVVFVDNVLSIRERGGTFHPPSDYVSESMRHIKMHNMNLVRVPVYWESYYNNSAAFMNQLEVVAQAAQENNICVIFDNHHWYTTSHWNIKKLGEAEGRGFPALVMKDFAVVQSADSYQSTAAPFWSAFLKNEISVGGETIWDVQLDFLKVIINKVDKYDNVIGYEILNEPHLFDSSQYDDLGAYHTYMAKGMREVTDKKIIFDRETTRGFQRIPALEYKIVPQNVSGLVYTPHLYTTPFSGTQAENQIANFKKWSDEWGVEVLVGEWSASTQEETDAYLRAFKQNGFGWTYYSWRPIESRGLGVSLYDTTWTPSTDGLRQLASSIEKVYLNPSLISSVAALGAQK